MTNKIKAMFTSSSTSEKLKISCLVPSNEKVKWVPIVKCNNGTLMGLKDDGIWVVEGKNGLNLLDNEGAFIYVMVILERPINDVRKEVKEFLDSVESEVDVNEAFPFVEIIKAGLEQGSQYWAELALKWLEEMTNEIKGKLLDSLVKVSIAKWASQKIRLNAKIEIKLLSKSS